MEKEPGQAEILPIGWKQEIHTPQHPNRELTPFKASMLKDISCGLGLEYANFANDWSAVSFSSVRAGTISERDSWKVLQDDMIAQSKSPVFRAWLASFLSLAASGNLPQAKAQKFMDHEFRGRRWMWVDPANDAKARELAVSHGWETNTQVTADMGHDFADNCDELRVEEKQSEGLKLGPVNPNGVPAPVVEAVNADKGDMTK
jgi:capsid protein